MYIYIYIYTIVMYVYTIYIYMAKNDHKYIHMQSSEVGNCSRDIMQTYSDYQYGN